MKKAILFDFGGTLDTDGIHWSEKFWEVYKEYKVPIRKFDFETAFVMTNNSVNKLIKSNDNLSTTLKKEIESQFNYLILNGMLTKFDANNLSDFIIDKCLNDAKSNLSKSRELLKRLKKNYKVGIVSNYYGNLKTVLKEELISEFVDCIIDSKVENVYKPNPEIFLLAITRLNAKPDETFVVGDSYSRDILPAKSLGCKTIWLDGKSWTRPNDTSQADFIIHSIEEVSNIVSQIGVG